MIHNGTMVQRMLFNGKEVQRWTHNGQTVFTAEPIIYPGFYLLNENIVWSTIEFICMPLSEGIRGNFYDGHKVVIGEVHNMFFANNEVTLTTFNHDLADSYDSHYQEGVWSFIVAPADDMGIIPNEYLVACRTLTVTEPILVGQEFYDAFMSNTRRIKQLKTPTISINGNVLTINDVSEKAERFTIHTEGISDIKIIDTTTFNLSSLGYAEGTYTIWVTAGADGYAESESSNSVEYVSNGLMTIPAGEYLFNEVPDFTLLEENTSCNYEPENNEILANMYSRESGLVIQPVTKVFFRQDNSTLCFESVGPDNTYSVGYNHVASIKDWSCYHEWPDPEDSFEILNVVDSLDSLPSEYQELCRTLTIKQDIKVTPTFYDLFTVNTTRILSSGDYLLQEPLSITKRTELANDNLTVRLYNGEDFEEAVGGTITLVPSEESTTGFSQFYAYTATSYPAVYDSGSGRWEIWGDGTETIAVLDDYATIPCRLVTLTNDIAVSWDVYEQFINNMDTVITFYINEDKYCAQKDQTWHEWLDSPLTGPYSDYYEGSNIYGLDDLPVRYDAGGDLVTSDEKIMEGHFYSTKTNKNY